MPDADSTPDTAPKFDFQAYPENTCFHERRTGRDRRAGTAPDVAKAPRQPRQRKERRRRVDPTTFEKQYTPDEIEFMSAMQHFKQQSGKPFPSYGEVLRVAVALGYRRAVVDADEGSPDTPEIPETLEPTASPA